MNSRTRRFTLAFALALAVTGAAAAQQFGGSVTIGITEEPDTLDPQGTGMAVVGTIMRYAGDTLISKGPDGEYVGALAESWTASEDGLTWTFHLRSGVTFHDGTPLNAAAVQASMERAIAPETQSPITGGLFSPISQFNAIDDLTLELVLAEPFSPFLDGLSDPRAAVINVAAADAAGDQFGRAPVLTGPWMVDNWVSGERITLVRNPDYAWGPDYAQGGGPYLDQVVFRVLPDAATLVAAFEANEAQVITVPAVEVERLQDTGRYSIESFLRLGVGLFLEFNTTAEPFTDPLVRRALNHAIDKNVVLQVAIEGLGVTAHGPLPPSIWGYWDDVVDYAPDYDPELALELLAEAGWTRDGNGPLQKDGVPFTFTLNSSPTDTNARSAQVVQQQLAQIGIAMDIQTFEFGTLLARLMAAEHQANFMGYTYTNPDIVYLWFHSDNIGTGLAHSHFDSPELDALINQSRTQTDPDDRLATYREIQEYVIDNSLWVPLWTNLNYMAVQPQVQDAFVHVEGYLFLLDAHID